MSKADNYKEKILNDEKKREEARKQLMTGDKDNSNINNEIDKHNSILHSVVTNKAKSETHIFKGFYLENEVAAVIDRVTAGKRKGVKSELVNEIIKNYFRQEGMM